MNIYHNAGTTKMKKVIRSTVVGVSGSLLLGLTIQANAATSFIANTWFDSTHPLGQYGYVEWAKDVKKISNSSLIPNVFTGTVLLPPRASLKGLKDGIVQVDYHAATYTPKNLPESNLLAELSLTYNDPLIMALASTDMNLNSPIMQAQWKKSGIVYGGGYATQPYRLICNKPVKNLSDLKGLKVRTSGAARSRWVESVGAIPVNISSTEMYTGLEKGAIDCASNTVSDLKSRSLWDVAKDTTMLSLGVYWVGWQWAYNPTFWKNLSSQNRRDLFDAQANAIANLSIGYKKKDDEALEEAKIHGVTIHQPSEEVKQSVIDFSKKNEASAIKLAKENFNIQHAEQLVNQFKKYVTKWEKLVSSIDRNDPVQISAIAKNQIFDKIDLDSYGTN